MEILVPSPNTAGSYMGGYVGRLIWLINHKQRNNWILPVRDCSIYYHIFITTTLLISDLCHPIISNALQYYLCACLLQKETTKSAVLHQFIITRITLFLGIIYFLEIMETR